MSIKLSEYIRKTLNEIAEGVINACDDIAEKTKNHPIAPAYIQGELKNTQLTNIDFEISTITKETESENGNIKFEVYVFGANGKNESVKENQAITKIKFSVPVLFSALKKAKN